MNVFNQSHLPQPELALSLLNGDVDICDLVTFPMSFYLSRRAHPSESCSDSKPVPFGIRPTPYLAARRRVSFKFDFLFLLIVARGYFPGIFLNSCLFFSCRLASFIGFSHWFSIRLSHGLPDTNYQFLIKLQ